MSKPATLTERDLQTLRAALNHAMDERDSFADAYGYKGPEAKRATDAVRRFERLHKKIFGCPSARTQEHARFAAMPAVPIMSLMGKARP